MSIIVHQTLPWSRADLELEDPVRWARLFPLIRPSVIAVSNILVDTSLASLPYVQLAAIGRGGNFSDKFLSDRHICAFATETNGNTQSVKEDGKVHVEDVVQALEDKGVGFEKGLVVVRSTGRRWLEVRDIAGKEVVIIEVDEELELDHVVSLVEGMNDDARGSIKETTELLKLFLKIATTAKTVFHEEKVEDNPSVKHEIGHHAFETAKVALEKDLVHILKSHTQQEEKTVYSVHYSDINGLSRLENYILAYEISQFLDSQNISYHITSSTLTDDELASRGWAISIFPVPQHFLPPQHKPPNTLSSNPNSLPSANGSTSALRASKLTFSNPDVRERIQCGCSAVISSEPRITEYDTIVGDGDCGLTLRDGANKVLEFIEDKDLSRLPQVLSSLVGELEVTMGGTSGALYCIFLSALAQALERYGSFPEALQGALEQLLKYTRARKGDRTCLDVLIPFVETLSSGASSQEALMKAKEGVDRTKEMRARLGRSAYLNDKTTRGVPDPGAYGLYCLLDGLCGATPN